MRYTLKQKATLLEAVLELYKGMSRQKAKQVISHSEFVVNGKGIEKHPNLPLEKGDVLEVNKVDTTKPKNLTPNRNNPIAIHFEDGHLVVALKPAGILSCGSKTDRKSNSFHDALEEYLGKRDDKRTKLWVVHRLDKEVEGLILFAKSEEVQTLIKDNWQGVTKKYLALTENKPDPENGIIENWLRDASEQRVVESLQEVPDSKFAKTEYQYVRAEKPYHLLEVQIYTGRKNQIRVHLAGIGCPIVGDRKYGADSMVLRQIRLAAYSLELTHPKTGVKISLQYTPVSKFFKPSKTENETYKVM